MGCKQVRWWNKQVELPIVCSETTVNGNCGVLYIVAYVVLSFKNVHKIELLWTLCPHLTFIPSTADVRFTKKYCELDMCAAVWLKFIKFHREWFEM